MKKYTAMTAAILMALLCMSGCGNADRDNSASVKVSVESVNNMTNDELRAVYQGTWEVSVVFVDNRDGIAFDVDKYKFNEDGTGTFTPQNGEQVQISWEVTPEGDLQVRYGENEDKIRNFEYVGGNLVNFEKEERGVVETHLAKTYDKNTAPDAQKN